MNARFWHEDGSVAFFHSRTGKKKQDWEAEGEGYSQKETSKNTVYVQSLQFHACRWSIAWFWEEVQTLYMDDTKVPPLRNGKPKKGETLDYFCKKYAKKFGQPEKNNVRNFTEQGCSVRDVVQLARDLAVFIQNLSVSPKYENVFGYKGLNTAMLGDLQHFAVAIAQKIATFLPHVAQLARP
eukprot:s3399_g14.t1